MKRNILLLFLAAGFIFSCSKDDAEPAQNAIVGEWQATELQIDNATAGDDAKFGKDILDYLTARDCFILKFNFNSLISNISLATCQSNLLSNVNSI